MRLVWPSNARRRSVGDVSWVRPGLVLIVFLALAGPVGAATAKVYCIEPVSPPPGCPASHVPEMTLTDAFIDAKNDTQGSDQIVLAAQTEADGPYVWSGSVPLEIDGQGQSASIITASSALSGSQVLLANGTRPLTLRNLGIQIPAGSDFHSSGVVSGATVSATISDVTVTSESSDFESGIDLNGGGTISRTRSVTVLSMFKPSVPVNSGITVSGAGTTTTITDSAASAITGLDVEGSATAIVDRCRVSGDQTGLFVSDAVVHIDSSLVQSNFLAMESDSVTQPTTISGAGLTIAPLDSGAAASYAAYARAQGTNNPQIALSDSILTNGFQHPIVTARTPGQPGIPTVATSYSDYDPTGILLYSGTWTPGAGDTPGYVDPRFADPANGDFHLLASSKLVGYRPVTGPVIASTDLDGLPRVTDGALDLGAFQHQRPTVTASVLPQSVKLGKAVTFSAIGSIVRPSDALTFGWKLDDGATAAGSAVSHTFTTGGEHTGAVTATDMYGFNTTADATTTVVGPPAVSALRQSNSVWMRGSKLATLTNARKHPKPRGKKRKPRPRIGTTFSFKLDQQANLTLVFVQQRGGRMSAAKCSVTAKHGKRCTLSTLRGTMTVSGSHPGANKIAFQGKLASGRLPAGRYTMTLTATNAEGETSKPASISFTIVAP